MQEGFDMAEWSKRVYLRNAMIGVFSFKCYRFLHNSEWEIEEHKANDLWDRLNSDMAGRLTTVCFDGDNSLEELQNYHLQLVNEGYTSISQWLGQWIDDIAHGLKFVANTNMYARVQEQEIRSNISQNY